MRIAAFSSRGPCTDRRVKPDVVAPGTDILSAKSKLASLQRFWGPGPQPEYAYMGGTSMAAPLVAGCAALVREYFVTTRGHAKPSAALLKATLINSTKKLPGKDATADFDVVPNMHQGYGVIHMPFAYPNPVKPALRLEFVDDWQTPARSFAGTGERRRYEINVAAGTRFSICLVWTDAPGRALQNNLNLLVETPAAPESRRQRKAAYGARPGRSGKQRRDRQVRGAGGRQVSHPDLGEQPADGEPGLRAGGDRRADVTAHSLTTDALTDDAPCSRFTHCRRHSATV